MKTISIKYAGLEKLVDTKDEKGDLLDCNGAFSVSEESPYELTFYLGDEEYGVDDLGEEKDLLSPEESAKYKDFDAIKFCREVPGCCLGLVYTNKGNGTIDIELPEDEEFDPKKAAVLIRKFLYQQDEYDRVMEGFIYDGRVYQCEIEWSDGKYSNVIWRAPQKDAVLIESHLSGEVKNLTPRDLRSMPILVFRSSQIGSYCEPWSNTPDIQIGEQMDKESLIMVQASCNEAEVYVKEGKMSFFIEHIGDYMSKENFHYHEVDVYIIEGFELLNVEENSKTEKEVLDTVAAVWDKSNKYVNCKPAFDKLLVRNIVHIRTDEEDPDEMDYNERFEINDFILWNNKLYKLKDQSLDQFINRPVQPSLFDRVLPAEVYARNVRDRKKYQRLCDMDAGEDML